MNNQKLILTTVDDNLMLMATPADKCVNPDNENYWFCDECGFGVPLPPGKIIENIFQDFRVRTDKSCVKCGSKRFSRSMLGNKI